MVERIYNSEPFDVPAAPLMKAAARLVQGFTGTYRPDIAWDSPDNDMMAYINANLHAFGAAKSYAQMIEMRDELTDGNGNLRSFTEFRKATEPIIGKYVENWLLTEWNQAIVSGQAAREWQSIEADQDIYPFLRYKAVLDARVRPEHAALNNTVLSVDSAFWNQYYPPNGWNCRCYAEKITAQEANGQVSNLDESMIAANKAVDSRKFGYNVGKAKMVFNGEHPYFKQMEGKPLRELRAEENYGLPSIERIYNRSQLLPERSQADLSQAKAWWAQNAKDGRIEVKNKALGMAFAMDKESLEHIAVERNRPNVAVNVPNAIANPDEVYVLNYTPNNSVESLPTYRFIKYYQDKPLIVNMGKSSDGWRVWTAYEPNEESMRDERKGILMYTDRSYQ